MQEKKEDIIVKAEDIYFSYDDEQTYSLDGFSLELKRGKKIAFLGANGAGKSTFFLTLNGIHKIIKGKLEVGVTLSECHHQWIALAVDVGQKCIGDSCRFTPCYHLVQILGKVKPRRLVLIVKVAMCIDDRDHHTSLLTRVRNSWRSGSIFSSATDS